MRRLLLPLAALVAFLAAIACTDAFAPDMGRLDRTARYTTIPAGKGLGMPDWPLDRWGAPPMTVGHETASPNEIGARLRLALQERLPVVLGPRRRDLTHNGETKGRFSLTNAKRSIDRYAAGPLTPDTVRKYAPFLRAWYSIDEPFSQTWGGVSASCADIKEYLRYFREKIDPLRLVPMAIRVSPSKLTDCGDWGSLLDVAWVVYKPGNRFGAAELIDREWDIARPRGWRLIAGMNAEDCEGVGTPPCSGADLREGLEPILRHTAVCASFSWKWTEATWRNTGIRDAWDYLHGVATSLPTTTCGAAVAGGGTLPPPNDGELARVTLSPDRIDCDVGETHGLTARTLDASGNELGLRVRFRSTDDGVLVVAQTGDRTATARCRSRGRAYAVAAKSGLRDRSVVVVQ